MKEEILIKRFDTELPLPEYKTEGAAAFDLYSRLSLEIPAHQVSIIPLNVAMQAPEGYWIMFVARSSLHKKGLMMSNGMAIMDADYSGDNDEYKAALYNFSDSPVQIERGERLVQAIIMPLMRYTITSVDHLDNPDRGGFGTTGHR